METDIKEFPKWVVPLKRDKETETEGLYGKLSGIKAEYQTFLKRKVYRVNEVIDRNSVRFNRNNRDKMFISLFRP